MPFTVVSTTIFRKNSKNFDEQEVRELKEEIRNNPLAGKPLQSNLKGISEKKFGRSPECRLLYYFDSNCKAKGVCKYKDKVKHEITKVEDCTGYLSFCEIGTKEYFKNFKKLKTKNLI